MADFPRKYLPYIGTSISEAADAAVDNFEAALTDRQKSVNTTPIFMPKMSDVKLSHSKLTINKSTLTADLKVYKIKTPGFFYYQHWKGNWNPRGWLQILVCPVADFSSESVYELMNTQDTSSGGSCGNDHVNNMFPMNPGDSTYVLLRGSIADTDETGNLIYEDRKLVYVPAWTGTDESYIDAIELMPIGVNMPSKIVSGSANDEGFKKCFAINAVDNHSHR